MGMPTRTRAGAVSAVLLLAGAAWADPGAPPAPAAGVYAGSITSYRYPGPTASRARQLFGAVAQDGTGYFISVPAPASDVLVFRNLAGIGDVASPEYEVPTEGRAVARGPRSWKITIVPAGSNAFRLKGKFNNISGYAALALQMLAATHRQVPLAGKGARYRGVDVNRGTEVTITVGGDGRFTGTDAARCRISGIFARTGNLNLYRVSVTFAGPSACPGAMTGAAFFSSRDRTGRLSGAPGPYLYLIGANGGFSHGFAMVLSHRRD